MKIAQFIAGPHLHADLLYAAQDAGYSAVIVHGTGLGHLPIENPTGDAPENDETNGETSFVLEPPSSDENSLFEQQVEEDG